MQPLTKKYAQTYPEFPPQDLRQQRGPELGDGPRQKWTGQGRKADDGDAIADVSAELSAVIFARRRLSQRCQGRRPAMRSRRRPIKSDRSRGRADSWSVRLWVLVAAHVAHAAMEACRGNARFWWCRLVIAVFVFHQIGLSSDTCLLRKLFRIFEDWIQ